MADEQKSDQKSKSIKRILLTISVFVAILPILLTPPLMDVRFWYTEYVSAMDYSASNIYEVWQQYLLPGRFVPISDFYVTTYIFLGHKFLQVTQAPLNYFDALTKLTLLVVIFFAIRSLFVELGKGIKESSRSHLWKLYPIGLFLVWSLGINIFWKFNGAVAYPIFIYTAFIIGLLFAVAVLKNLRVLSHTGRIVNRTTILLLVLSSIWANFFYEISYTAIGAIVVAILVAPIAGLTRQMRLKFSALFI